MLAALCLAPAPAHAIGGAAPIDANRFHPAPGIGKILTVDIADVGPHLSLVPQLFLHYADRPLVYTLGGIPEAELLRHRVTADLSLAFSVWQRLQVALAFPVTLYQAGDQVTFPVPIVEASPPPKAATAGQEDLRLLIKGMIWRNETFGFGAVGDLSIPTGNADSYLGSPMPTFNLRLVGHVTYKRLTAGLNVGWLFARTEQVLNVQTGMGLSYSGGAQIEVYRHKDNPIYVLAEVTGLAHSRFSSVKESPAELLLGGKARYNDWTFFLGAGPGLSQGYGEPRVRVFAGASWSWQHKPRPKPPKPPTPPPQPPPPPDEGTCQGDDCPPDKNRPVRVQIQGPQLVLSERVFFDFDKDTIKPISFPLLDEVVRVLRARPDLGNVRIEGHTDGIGSDVYNLDLSQRRARSVVNYLAEHGIDPSRLSSIGYGKRCPLVSNDTPDNRARNRRVDFILVDQNTVITHDPAQCPPPRQQEISERR